MRLDPITRTWVGNEDADDFLAELDNDEGEAVQAGVNTRCECVCACV